VDFSLNATISLILRCLQLEVEVEYEAISYFNFNLIATRNIRSIDFVRLHTMTVLEKTDM